MKQPQSENFKHILKVYKEDCKDLSTHHSSMNHHHCHVYVGDTIISIVQEPNYSGASNLEYAIIENGVMQHLADHGDSVARYQNLEVVIDVIEKIKQKESGNE